MATTSLPRLRISLCIMCLPHGHGHGSQSCENIQQSLSLMKVYFALTQEPEKQCLYGCVPERPDHGCTEL